MDVYGWEAQPGQHSEFQDNQSYIGLCHKTQDGEGKGGREKRKTQTCMTVEAETGVLSITSGTLRRYPSHWPSKGLWPSRHLDFLLPAVRLC